MAKTMITTSRDIFSHRRLLTTKGKTVTEEKHGRYYLTAVINGDLAGNRTQQHHAARGCTQGAHELRGIPAKGCAAT